MRTSYRHKQFGSVMVFGIAAAIVAIIALLGPAAAHPALLVVLGLLAALAVVFSSLTVQVTPSSLVFWFGPGVLRKQVPLGDIAEVEAVRNPWWWGIGWRLTPRGMLYSVSGLGAVEITRKNGSRFRLGSDEPERLARALQAARERPL
jgi:hypothetical protein